MASASQGVKSSHQPRKGMAKSLLNPKCMILCWILPEWSHVRYMGWITWQGIPPVNIAKNPWIPCTYIFEIKRNRGRGSDSNGELWFLQSISSFRNRSTIHDAILCIWQIGDLLWKDEPKKMSGHVYKTSFQNLWFWRVGLNHQICNVIQTKLGSYCLQWRWNGLKTTISNSPLPPHMTHKMGGLS